MINHSAFNWPDLLKLTNNNTQLAQDMVAMFIAELPSHRDKINQAYSQKDMVQLADHVHKLQGSCCYAGATNLRILTNKLEQALENEIDENIDQLVHTVEKEIEFILTNVECNTTHEK